MALNLIHRTVIGETGKTLGATLYDTNEVTRQRRIINLTGYTVHITVKTSQNVVIINDQLCTIDAVPTIGKITFNYDATVLAWPNLIAGDHRIRFRLTAPDLSDTFVPKRDAETYGIFRVLEP